MFVVMANASVQSSRPLFSFCYFSTLARNFSLHVTIIAASRRDKRTTVISVKRLS